MQDSAALLLHERMLQPHLASWVHVGPDPAAVAILLVGVTPSTPASSKSSDATTTMLPSDLPLPVAKGSDDLECDMRHATFASTV